MLSIDEILEKTVLIRYNFKAWRRNGLQLLPKPVSVDKKNILFDDSILERIKLIGDQQAALMVYTTIISNSIVHFVEVLSRPLNKSMTRKNISVKSYN